MTWGLVATAGGAILGAYSSSRAAKTQANAVRQGMESQERMYEQTRADQEKYRLAGEEAINALRPLSMDYRPFTAEGMYNDPGYGFRLSEGQKMIDRQAAARGGLISGNALKAAARYGQDYASGEFNNAFNRYLAERNAQLGPLQFLVNAGQGAANVSSSAATNFGNTQAQGYSDIGNAQASGYMGMANAVSGAANNYLGYQNSQNYINAMRPGSAYSGTGMPSYSLWSPGTRIGSGIGG